MYYVVTQKKNKIAFAGKLMKSEIILGKISQTQKDQFHLFFSIQNLYLKENFTKAAQHTGITRERTGVIYSSNGLRVDMIKCIEYIFENKMKHIICIINEC